MNHTDCPVSAASATPNGPNKPWLIALLRNNTLATSIGKSTNGSSPASTIPSEIPPRTSKTPCIIGPITCFATIARTVARIPNEKLSINISKPSGEAG